MMSQRQQWEKRKKQKMNTECLRYACSNCFSCTILKLFLKELGIDKVAMNLRMNAESDGIMHSEVCNTQNEDKI